jgi:sugar O-acyltransferase (sialic acid O-acetyltransferase NeuD family)
MNSIQCTKKTMLKKLLIVGASGFGKEVAWLTERINEKLPTWELLGFIDDNSTIHGQTVGHYKVLGGCDKISNYPNAYLVCAVGAAKTRKHLIEKISKITASPQYAILIDPQVEMSAHVAIGTGTIICAHSILTVDITIGQHVIVNLDCTIGHDAVLNDFVTLYPSVNVSGNCTIEQCVELGTGTQIIQGKTIGEESIVGAGSVVVKDIPSKCTAVGSPAKPIKFN